MAYIPLSVRRKAVEERMRGPGQPPLFRSVEDFNQRVAMWLEDRTREGKPLTLSSLALYLDTDRMTLLNYSVKDEYFGAIKKVKAICENWVEDKLMTEKNVPGFIFSLVNNYGWINRQNMDLTSKGESLVSVDGIISSIETAKKRPPKEEKKIIK